MRIGIDFDNTIVCYTGLFYREALRGGLIDQGVGEDKQSVRDDLRNRGREDDWTRLQGVVYGEGIADAPAFEGVIDFMRGAIGEGHDIFIVSHKTRFPVMGEAVNLHEAAKGWLKGRGFFDRGEGGAGLALGSAYFEESKGAKMRRVAALGCDVFVDDLPEFLGDEDFPKQVDKILFDPYGKHMRWTGGKGRLGCWADAGRMILGLGGGHE